MLLEDDVDVVRAARAGVCEEFVRAAPLLHAADNALLRKMFVRGLTILMTCNQQACHLMHPSTGCWQQGR